MAVSFWEKQNFFSFDILVIGAGIVGLSSAYYLKKKFPKLKIAILEAGFLPNGASTKNAGFACFGSISELIEQEKSIGKEGLQKLVAKRWKGLQRLRGLLGDHTLDFQPNGGFEIFLDSDTQMAGAAQDKISYYNALLQDIIGDKQIYSDASSKINTFGLKNTSCLIENTQEGQINTGKMMYALMQKTTAEGVLILNNCNVHSIKEAENGIDLLSNQGTFHAAQVLVCTNGFTSHLLPTLDIVPGRGQVLVTKPLPGLKLKGTFHYDKGYYYFRNIGNRILIGGGRNLDYENEETTTFGLNPKITERLQQLLLQIIYPSDKELIAYKWSGIMGFGKTGVFPLIQPISSRLYCAVRSSGMGVAMGTELGFEAAHLMKTFH